MTAFRYGLISVAVCAAIITGSWWLARTMETWTPSGSRCPCYNVTP